MAMLHQIFIAHILMLERKRDLIRKWKEKIWEGTEKKNTKIGSPFVCWREVVTGIKGEQKGIVKRAEGRDEQKKKSKVFFSEEWKKGSKNSAENKFFF